MLRSTLFLLLAAVVPAFAQSDPPQKTNIVVIVADDLGYAELGCQGCPDIATPNIDSIARDGVRFTAGYATCAVCAPTRAALMLGRYQQRYGFEHNPGPPGNSSPVFGLPEGVPTLAERLRDAGYSTGMVGKWHLGYSKGTRPLDRGFQEFFGFLAGAHDYDPEKPQNADPLRRGEEPVTEKEYLTRAFSREAAAFIKKRAGEPFFLYMTFNAVHAPMQPDPACAERVAGIKNADRRKFASMLTSLDDAVGVILAALREHKVEERTLVFFMSDNGGPTLQTTSSNTPLSGQKGMVYEGGIRVPYLARWKGRLPAGKVYDEPVSTMDIHATALAAAGVKLPEDPNLDGASLLPFLEGKAEGRPHEALFWRMGAQAAARVGDWKLVMEKGEPDALFNLKEDIGERENLAVENAEKLKELRAAYAEWEKGTIAAKWKRGAGK
ncbi:MAG: sulfatase-like hydrolase/transferase [Planctomycetota bacterium]